MKKGITDGNGQRSVRPQRPPAPAHRSSPSCGVPPVLPLPRARLRFPPTCSPAAIAMTQWHGRWKTASPTVSATAPFGSNNTCTRGQSVTFLYRAMGTAPTTVNGFTDVAAGAFYADAVAWAVENGVTNGTTAATFSPNARLHPRPDRHLPVPHLSGQVRGISLYNAKRGHQIFWWPRALLMNGILLMSLCGSAFSFGAFFVVF